MRAGIFLHVMNIEQTIFVIFNLKAGKMEGATSLKSPKI